MSMNKIKRVCVVALVLALASLADLAAQMDGLDLNDYYRFPLSLGIQYRAMTPLEEYRSSYDLLDLSAVFSQRFGGLPVGPS